MTAENAAELLAAATHKTKLEVEQEIASRFPRLEVPDTTQQLPTPAKALGERQDPAIQTTEGAPGQ